MDKAAPAGWYSDPAGTGGFRYWDGAAWSDQSAVSKIPKPKRHIAAKIGIVAGIFIAVAPIIVAFVGSLGSNVSMFDESSGSGAAIFLVFMTVPLGIAVAAIGAGIGTFLQWRERSR